jgi:hypothetical protein
MPANERPNWGVLEKRTSNPHSVPYDILVWKPTREHFDVLTSYPISGNKDDTTGPRKLVARWAPVGILPKATWHWCDWRATQTPIVPLAGTIEEPEQPSTPPLPPPPPDASLERRVTFLEDALRRVKAAL